MPLSKLKNLPSLLGKSSQESHQTRGAAVQTLPFFWLAAMSCDTVAIVASIWSTDATKRGLVFVKAINYPTSVLPDVDLCSAECTPKRAVT